jgi:hypothetical protein
VRDFDAPCVAAERFSKPATAIKEVGADVGFPRLGERCSMSPYRQGVVQRQERSAPRWLARLRNRAELVAGQGARLANDRRPISAMIGRAQVQRAQRFVSFHAQGRPFAIASVAVGAGLILGAALAFSAKRSSPLNDPEEIVARALCREDPDGRTHRGPLWSGYRKDARRVLAALRSAQLLAERGDA